MTPQAFRAGLRALKLPQRQLALRLRVAPGTVNRWARGKAPIPESVRLLLACWRRDGVPSK
jgi:transcriptional regulator with XRE-family HTH domain